MFWISLSTTHKLFFSTSGIRTLPGPGSLEEWLAAWSRRTQ